MSAARVRFAPSPTGFLHLGGARTAFYNWLWARKTSGKFILRIEDTDRERSTDAALAAIFESLRWLGLDWDEGPEVGGAHGPYLQMQRLEVYKHFAERLIAAGAAYRCYCTAEDLARARAEHKQRTGGEHGFRYPGTCRERSDEPDKPFVVRLRAPSSGTLAWDDLIKGRLEFPSESQQDAVLLRNNGVPLYNLGAVVDDITMGITLVARADDHVVNTPQQLLLYRALSEPPPQFAHLPLILGKGGEKMSKRDAAVAVLDYRDAGFLPDGVLNYLVRLGWSHGDQEIFTRAELIEKFDWEHVGHTGARFDIKKFEHVQAEHLRMLKPAQAAVFAAPFVRARGLFADESDPRLAAAVALVLPRATTLAQVAEAIDYFFRDAPEIDAAAADQFLAPERVPVLEALSAEVADVAPFARGALEAKVKAWAEAQGLPLQDVAQPARVALTGRKASPGLFEVMEVLGRDRTLARLAAAATRARAQR